MENDKLGSWKKLAVLLLPVILVVGVPMNAFASIEDWGEDFILTPGDPPNDGILFADLEAQGRSGHLGHALVEYAPGEILAFYPNCSTIVDGHNGHGWMEYKRSTDGGETWSEPFIEPNSKAMYDQSGGYNTMMCEKAVCTDDGTIVLFYLTCKGVMDVNGLGWGFEGIPRCAFSRDGGETFTEAKELFGVAGRIYDAVYQDGVIYVLFMARGTLYLFASEDNGETFKRRSTVPFQPPKDYGICYGTMAFMPDGSLIVYTYHVRDNEATIDRNAVKQGLIEIDECNQPYLISHDNGKTWDEQKTAYFAKKLRNPQLAYFGGRWWMHGRSGHFDPDCGHFVLYSSEDGIHWDDGQYLRMATAWAGAYSNNLVVHLKDGRERLLIQSSHAYYKHQTNVIMWWIDKAQ